MTGWAVVDQRHCLRRGVLVVSGWTSLDGTDAELTCSIISRQVETKRNNHVAATATHQGGHSSHLWRELSLPLFDEPDLCQRHGKEGSDGRWQSGFIRLKKSLRRRGARACAPVAQVFLSTP